jgi:hypothetical protein
MRLAARAWKLRQDALEALRGGYAFLAEDRASESVNTMSSEENLALRALVGTISYLKTKMT